MCRLGVADGDATAQPAYGVVVDAVPRRVPVALRPAARPVLAVRRRRRWLEAARRPLRADPVGAVGVPPSVRTADGIRGAGRTPRGAGRGAARGVDVGASGGAETAVANDAGTAVADTAIADAKNADDADDAERRTPVATQLPVHRQDARFPERREAGGAVGEWRPLVDGRDVSESRFRHVACPRFRGERFRVAFKDVLRLRMTYLGHFLL